LPNRLIVIIFLALSLSACATVSIMKQNDPHTFQTKIWHEAPAGDAKAVVILLHGLNLKPQRMDDWANLLVNHGAHVIRFALYGHTGDQTHMANVTANTWRAQFNGAIEAAQDVAHKQQVPIYFVGFSLGALVGLEWLSGNHDEHEALFDKMVLIAPALSVPWYSRAAINSLAMFGRGFMLPSRSPEGYRANKGTTIAAYQSLFELKDSLMKQRFKHANIDTLVLMDKHDELVDSKNIRKLIWDFKLNAWKLEVVDNRFAYDNYGFRHLMVDKEAVGSTLWDRLSQMMVSHLGL
jgi:esterase/lipase